MDHQYREEVSHMHAYRIGGDVTVLNDQVEVPGLGFLPVNAFVLHAAQPVVVDTGLGLAAGRWELRMTCGSMATGLGTRFLDMLAAAPDTDAFIGPDQQALQHLFAGFEPGATAA
jgi:hypothetical protein